MASKFKYEEVPSFKRQSTGLSLLNFGTNKNARFYGNLVVSCTGRTPCYSKFSKLMLSITRSSGPSDENEGWTADDKMTIRGVMWTKTEKLRKYFISLLEHTENTIKYKELYDNLCNDKYKVSDDVAMDILDSMAQMVKDHNESLLQCLANFTCKHGSRPLWTELTENGVENDELLDQQAILEKVEEVHQSPFYQDMVDSGVTLTDNEILSIYIYCSNDEFADLMQKHLKIGCKWKQTFYYFVRGVLKIYNCKVFGSKVDSLPQSLYHPVFLSYENGVKCPLELLSTVNCTSSKSCATDFAPPDGSMFVLENTAQALSNGTLIAAPVNWISPHPSEDEWVILPCTLLECSKPTPFVHESQMIRVTSYKAISPIFYGVDVHKQFRHCPFYKQIVLRESADDSDSKGDDAQELESLDDYKREVIRLNSEVSRLKRELYTVVSPVARMSSIEETTPKSDDSKNEEKSQIPFKKIENEAFLIYERDVRASMNVTICNGELNPPFISAKGIEWLKRNYVANEHDIFVDSYAKSGTTVTIKMVYLILQTAGIESAGANAEKLNDPWNAVPWIEVEASQQLMGSPSPNDLLSMVEESNKNKKPRIWKTHAPFCNFPAKSASGKCKIIHVYRNPKDVICSYYDFFKKEPLVKYEGDFDTLFDWFCDGTVVHSNFFEFELNWFRKKSELSDNLMFVAYEDIVQKPAEVIRRVCAFLDLDKVRKLSEKQIEEIANKISFKQAKKEIEQSKNASDIKAIVNKGKIGRWKDILSSKQNARMDRIINAKLKNSGIKFEFGH